MKRSVESWFITIVSATLLCVVVPLFTLFLALSSQQANSALRSQIELLLSTNAKALGKPVWDLDEDTVRQTVLGMVTDPAVRSIRLDDRLGKLKVIETAATSARFFDLESISLPIILRRHRLIVTVSSAILSVDGDAQT